MDIATYGVGIFTPTIIATVVTDNSNDFIGHSIFSIGSSAFIYIFLIIGFLINILIVEKYGRIKLQLIGFLGMAAGLVILGCSTFFLDMEPFHLIVLFAGFIIYNFLMNMGHKSIDQSSVTGGLNYLPKLLAKNKLPVIPAKYMKGDARWVDVSE